MLKRSGTARPARRHEHMKEGLLDGFGSEGLAEEIAAQGTVG